MLINNIQSNCAQPINEHLIATPQELTECCRHLAAEKRFGFDTEFVGEDSYHPKLCLVQVATTDSLYLIDPQTVGSLDEFWRLVVDPENLVIVHAGREEVRMCRSATGSPPGNLFDLQIAAGLVGLNYPISHTNLVSTLLGIRLGTAQTLTEWRSRPLTPAQIRYAFEDVRYLLPLWEALFLRLDKLNRLSWAKEEFVRLSSDMVSQETVSSARAAKWRKLRGLGTLDRRQLAVVQRLYDWREQMASLANRPARTIVRDDLLVEIARRNPKRPRDLQVVRGLPKRRLEELFNVVNQARSLPLQQCPPLPNQELDPNQLGFVTHVLTAALGSLCAERHIATALVATNQDVKSLVRSFYRNQPLANDCLLSQGWRAEHFLPDLLALLEGKCSLRINDVHSEAPLTIEG